MRSLTPSKFLTRSRSAKTRQQVQGEQQTAADINCVSPLPSNRDWWAPANFNYSLWSRCPFPGHHPFFGLSFHLVKVWWLLPSRHLWRPQSPSIYTTLSDLGNHHSLLTHFPTPQSLPLHTAAPVVLWGFAGITEQVTLQLKPFSDIPVLRIDPKSFM